jgi:hypothetical protein
MSAQSAASGAARRQPVAVLVGAAVLVAVVVAAAVTVARLGDGSAGKSAASALHAGPITTESTAQFKAAIVARMRAQHLNYQWVACVPSGRRFEGVRVVRCNVDFGIDPHVEAYCSVLSGGRLLTSEDDPAIPCGADLRGRMPKLITYG